MNGDPAKLSITYFWNIKQNMFTDGYSITNLSSILSSNVMYSTWFIVVNEMKWYEMKWNWKVVILGE